MKARVKKIKEDTSFSYECRTIIFNTDLVNMIGRVIEVEEECRDEVYMSDDQFYFHKSWLEFNPDAMTIERLLCKINKVTSPHRHGQKIPKRDLDALCNAQIEFEKTLKSGMVMDK